MVVWGDISGCPGFPSVAGLHQLGLNRLNAQSQLGRFDVVLGEQLAIGQQMIQLVLLAL